MTPPYWLWLVLSLCALSVFPFGCKDQAPRVTPTARSKAPEMSNLGKSPAKATLKLARSNDSSKEPWIEGTTRESYTYSAEKGCERGLPGCKCLMPSFRCKGSAQCYWGHCYGEGFPAPDTYRYTRKATMDYGRIKDRILANLKLKPGMNVADIGAGRGNYSFAIADSIGADGIVYSTDIDPGAIEELSRKQRVRADSVEKVSQLKTILVERERETGLDNLPDSHLDLILIVNSVTFERRDKPAENLLYLRTLLTKLRSGGQVLYHTDWYEPSGGFDLKEISALFAEAGFAETPSEIPLPEHIPEATFFLKYAPNGSRTEVSLTRGYILLFKKP